MFSRVHKPEPVLEDVLRQLVDYDVVVLMDDSGSMLGKNWKHAEKVMIGVVEEAIKYDTNGIEIKFLNDTQREATVKTKGQVKELFRRVVPRGSTPLGKRLEAVCEAHIKAYGSPGTPKNIIVIAITDGIPNDKAYVYTAIKGMAKKLDESNAPRAYLGIQFVQIGKDSDAKEFLQDLDDNLKGSEPGQVGRDMVDTVPYKGKKLTSEELVKILVGAINKRIDSKNIDS